MPSPGNDLPALLVGALEMFGKIYILFWKSHSRPWGYEVLVPIGNAQVMFWIEDIDLFRYPYPSRTAVPDAVTMSIPPPSPRTS